MSAFLRRAIQLSVLAVVALAWVAVFTSPPAGGPLPLPTWIYPLPGSAFAIAGLVAWSLRPMNRVGLLMIGAGVGLLVGSAAPLPISPIPRSISSISPLTQMIAVSLFNWLGRFGLDLFVAASPLWAVVLLHLLLAFPGGRLGSWQSRGLVVALYVFVPLIGLVALNSPFVLTVWPGLEIDYPTALSIIYQACFAVGFVLITKRWIQGGQARRRSLAPVLWSLGPLSVAFLIPTLQGVLPQVATTQTNTPVIDSFLNALEIASSLLLIILPIAVVIGLLRAGLDMTSVASLVVKLSKGLLPDELQPALAKVLHDPSLEVLYWVPSLDGFADLNGRAVELPAPDSERAASVLSDETRPVAALVYDASLLHEPELVETAAAAVRMALQNAGLQAQLRAQLEEVRQSRARLVEAGQQERQRVERDLHDGAQQQLVSLLLALQATRAEASQHPGTETAAMLDANISTLKQALSELRELARGIHPSILTEAGLVPALRSLAERSPVPVEINAYADDGRLPAQLEATLYFVAAEAITNAVKHSGARRIQLSLRRDSRTVELDVCDDGHGGAEASAGSGLRGLSDRVAAVGGRLHVQSDERHGTTVHSEIPCA